MMFELPKFFRRKQGNWTLPLSLLGIYFFLKLQGWNYGFRANDLERQLGQLRPTLSAIVLAEQMESTRKLYSEICDKVGRLDIKGSQLLQLLSQTVPAEITIGKMEVTAEELQIQGVVRPGVRIPEDVLTLWARRLQENWDKVQIQEIEEDPQTPGIWHFQLKAKGISDA